MINRITMAHDHVPIDIDHAPPLIALVDAPIDLLAVQQFLEHPQAGGQALFIGTVRDHNHGRQVESLEYEAYAPMALKLMAVLAAHLQRTHHPVRIALVHRLGSLKIGEAAVMVGVSAVHRDAAFLACREGIDRLKLEIPIWKKELFVGGARWVDNCQGCAAVAEDYERLLADAPRHSPQGSIEHPGDLIEAMPL